MANVSIESATIGYDTVGLQAFTEKLNLIVFNGAAKKVMEGINPLNLAVDSVWAGQAANSFKAKFERDANTLCDTLNNLEEELRSQFATVAKNVDEYDSSMAESIDQM